MKRKIISVSRLANQLTDPKPEFVSLVGHGANQTPFLAVKSEQVADFRKTEITEKKEMTKKTVSKVAKKAAKQAVTLPNVAEVQKITFDGKRFKDEAAVTEFMESKAYSDFKVTKVDGGFAVVAKEETDFEGELKTLPVDEGVTFFVGKLAADAEPLETEGGEDEDGDTADDDAMDEEDDEEADVDADDEEVEGDDLPENDKAKKMAKVQAADADEDEDDDDAAKAKAKDKGKAKKSAEPEKVFKAAGMTSSEIVKKYCDYCSCSYQAPEGKTMADVLSEQYSNGTFPAMYELNSAFFYALYNLVKEGDKAGIKTLSAEYGDMIVAILEALDTAGVDTTAVKAIFEKEPDEKDTAMKTQDTKAKKADDKEQGTDGKDTAAPEQKSDAKSDTDIAAIVASAVKAAVEPLNQTVKTLSEAVETNSKATKESLAELEDKVSKANEGLDELSQSRQSRKSADDEGVPEEQDDDVEDEVDAEEEKSKKAYQQKVIRGAIGF